MGKGTLSKVMKYKLTYLDGCGDFHTMQSELWELQRQTREILNRTIQMTYHWDYTDYEHFKETGEHLNMLHETGYKRIDGYIYDCIKDRVPNFASGNLNATIQSAWKKYNSVRADVSRGEMSLPSYKRDQPLVLHNQSLKLAVENGKPMIVVTLFSGSYKKEKGYGKVRLAVHLDDKTQRAIFHNVLTGEYGLGQCQISYERPNWYLSLTYHFEPQKCKLDAEKVLGVDMGETVAIYASSYGEFGSLRIDGGEVTEFAARLEARRKSMQRQAAVCGEGRIGHGTRTRVADVYRTKEKIANFRDTINHRYSKKLVDYAVQHQYGVIQMEDLSGIKEDMDISTAKFLRHWTYYDLQQKIEYKAKEVGINVVKVAPAYTSQRCSRCGYIDSGNRPSQAKFKCLKCGYATNADFNASQNLSIPKIDEIIQIERSANKK